MTDSRINELAQEHGLTAEGYWSEDAIAFGRDLLRIAAIAKGAPALSSAPPTDLAEVQRLRAAPAGARAGDGIPAGWKLVPLEPTREMISATEACAGIRTINNILMLHAARTGLRELPGCGDTPEESPVAQAYRAMLAAAPALSAPAQLPPAYMLAKLQMVMPVFREARDALTALTEAQRKLRGISPTLADRMDEAGTFSLDDWTAAQPDFPAPVTGERP